MEDSLIGTLLDGKYRIEKVLGQGGMAKVYRATQEPLGRKVAVKVLTHMSPDPSVREIDEKRFFREASLASKLTHPNTVIIHDYGTLAEGKGLFLVMEYLDGTSLGGLLARVGHLRWEAAYPIIKQIAGSLNEAHKKGLIHRDLKPLNIMVSQKVGAPVYAKVLDFGLAKPMKEADDEQVTVKGTIIGSPLYMSPEQIFNEDVDHRSDIYSLGVLAFEMLTGRPPFILEKNGHVRELLKKHLTGTIPEMRSINPHSDAPPEVEFAIRRCLAKKSKDRFASVQELVESLQEIQSDNSSGSIHETADFTHHHLRPKSAGPTVDTVSEDNPAFSTTRVGTDDEVAPASAAAKPWTSKRSLIALAAVLALGIGLTVSLTSGNQETNQDVAVDAPSQVTPPAPAGTHPAATTASVTPTEKEERVEGPGPNEVVAPISTTKSPVKGAKETIRVVFKSQPEGAEVFRKGERLSENTTPFTMEFSKGEVAGTYTFQKRGFMPTENAIEGDIQGDELEVMGTLKRAKKTRKRNRSSNPLRRRER